MNPNSVILFVNRMSPHAEPTAPGATSRCTAANLRGEQSCFFGEWGISKGSLHCPALVNRATLPAYGPSADSSRLRRWRTGTTILRSSVVGTRLDFEGKLELLECLKAIGGGRFEYAAALPFLLHRHPHWKQDCLMKRTSRANRILERPVQSGQPATIRRKNTNFHDIIRIGRQWWLLFKNRVFRSFWNRNGSCLP
jgi:hypothetical protein